MLNFTVYNMEFCEIKMLLVMIKCSRKMKINKTGNFFYLMLANPKCLTLI